VVDQYTVAYLDLTGSGVKTIAHLRDNGRIVIMLCAFDGPAPHHPPTRPGRGGPDRRPALRQLGGLLSPTPADRNPLVIVVDIARVSDSCGFGVPRMRLEGQRPLLPQWAARKGPDATAEYQATRNAVSIDGLPGLAP
jgi:hypothetical protein